MRRSLPLLCLCALLAAPLSAKTLIRTATIIPDGTPLMKALRDMADEVTRETDGEVVFKFYPGGTIGDEKLVINKMQSGKIQASALTGVGLGELVPEVRILDIPWFYESQEQMAYVLDALSDRFVSRFEDEGFVHLGWNQNGAVFVYSKYRVQSVNDMRERKPWIWEGDPLAEEVFRSFEINPTPLPLTGVLTSLQTGLVDTVYNTPAALIGLQWHSDIKFVVDYPIVYTVGAFLMTKAAFEKIPEKYRERVREICQAHATKIDAYLVEENRKAVKTLQERGVESIKPNEEDSSKFSDKGKEVAKKLTGRLWDERLMERVLDLKEEYLEERDAPSE